MSTCNRYRYLLGRRLRPPLKRVVVFLMLNPSTADALEDDATVRRCLGYAAAWGYEVLLVVNLFAYRATDPKELPGVDDPIGPLNEVYILKAAEQAEEIVCAWGVHGDLSNRAKHVVSLLDREGYGPKLRCFGLNKNGQPRHPVRLSRAASRSFFSF